MPGGWREGARLDTMECMAEEEKPAGFDTIRNLVSREWQQMLGEPAAIDENLFLAGASSLSALRVLAVLNTMTGLDLTLRDFLENPTMNALAAVIARRVTALPAATGGPVAAAAPYARGQRTEARTSANQRQRLIRDEVQIRELGYRQTQHVAVAYELCGELDMNALAEAFRVTAASNAVLRSSFPSGERAVIAHEPIVDMVKHDLSDANPEYIHRAVADLCVQQFDVGTGPCWRAGLLRVDAHEWILALAFDHLIMDNYSIGLLEQQLSAGYSALLDGKECHRESRGIDYYDWSDWQWERNDGDRIGGLLDWWRADLGATEPDLDLAWPALSPPKPARPDRVRHVLSPEIMRSVRLTATALRTTPSVILLTAFARVLAQYADMCPNAIVVPSANRGEPAIASVMGWISTTSLVPCAGVDRVPFGEAVRIINSGVRALDGRGMVSLATLLPKQTARSVPPAWPYFDMVDRLIYKGLILEGVKVSRYPVGSESFGDRNTSEGYGLVAGSLPAGDLELTGHYSSGKLTADMARGVLHSVGDAILSAGS
jgi:hypothetical protein